MSHRIGCTCLDCRHRDGYDDFAIPLVAQKSQTPATAVSQLVRVTDARLLVLARLMSLQPEPLDSGMPDCAVEASMARVIQRLKQERR
jgi:hypothetical protein